MNIEPIFSNSNNTNQCYQWKWPLSIGIIICGLGCCAILVFGLTHASSYLHIGLGLFGIAVLSACVFVIRRLSNQGQDRYPGPITRTNLNGELIPTAPPSDMMTLSRDVEIGLPSTSGVDTSLPPSYEMAIEYKQSIDNDYLPTYAACEEAGLIPKT